MAVPDTTPGIYTIDVAHSQVSFSVRHLMVSKVRGNFTKFEGTYEIKPDVLASAVSVSIDATSIDTRDENRDNHLRTADFFEVEKHPTFTFTSTSIQAKGDDYILTGDLTIKGNSRSVDLALEFNGSQADPWGGTRTGFSAVGEISRKEFGVDIDIPLDGGGVVIGDKVKIEIEVEGVLQTAPAEAAAAE